MLPDVRRSRDQMTAMRCGLSIGNGRTSTLSITLKTAVLAPIATANVQKAASVTAGLLPRTRRLWRISVSIRQFSNALHEAVAEPDDAAAVGGIRFGVGHLHDRGALFVERLEQLHDVLALRRVQVAGR